jgi:hypothetical protein
VVPLDSRHVAAANLQPLFHNKVAPLYLFHGSPFFRSPPEFKFDSLLSFVYLLSSLTLVFVYLLLRLSIAASGFNASAIDFILATDLHFLGKFWISRVGATNLIIPASRELEFGFLELEIRSPICRSMMIPLSLLVCVHLTAAMSCCRLLIHGVVWKV